MLNSSVLQPETSPEQPILPKKRVFLVFEGGGAKGIVHVGALRAIEREQKQIEIAGVAGTSAGAIVAALVAAGYSAEELVADDGTSALLRSLGMRSATDFFGRNWDRLALARWTVSDPPVAFLVSAIPATAIALATVLLAHWHWAVGILIWIGCLVTTIAWTIFVIVRGLCSLDLLVEKLDQALSKKLGIGRHVCFEDLEERGRPLRIVATDVAARQLKLFSRSETPHVRVAEAVAASAALPLACAHRVIDGCRYIDGGIVSNLPAWTFDEERALDPDAITIAVTIDAGTPTARNATMGPIGLSRSILTSAMFGRQRLETRAAPRLLVLSLKTEIEVVDFDIDGAKAAESVRNSDKAASLLITERLFKLPKRIEDACGYVGGLIGALPDPTIELPPHRTRILLALRDPGAISSWRIQEGWNLLPMDADDQLLLPQSSSIIGRAAIGKEPVLAPLPLNPEFGLSERADRYRKALVRKDLNWCLAIPIFDTDDDTSPVIAVLSVDSDLALQYFDFDRKIVAELAEEASAIVRPLVQDILKVR